MHIGALWIDVQNDFMDNGALPVPGALESAETLGRFITDHGDKISHTMCTLDCHQERHIAHPIMWLDENGRHPDPLTTILSTDYEEGKYRVSCPGAIIDNEVKRTTFKKWAYDYLKAAEVGRSPLTIWNPHCLIGTAGNNLAPVFNEAMRKWGERRLVQYLSKGSHPFTEHYSAFQAEVPIPTAPSTMLDMDTLEAFKKCDMILFGGQELFHCVRWTAEDLMTIVGKDDPNFSKFVLLRDTTNVIPVFEDDANKWLTAMQGKGMRVETTETIFN